MVRGQPGCLTQGIKIGLCPSQTLEAWAPRSVVELTSTAHRLERSQSSPQAQPVIHLVLSNGLNKSWSLISKLAFQKFSNRCTCWRRLLETRKIKVIKVGGKMSPKPSLEVTGILLGSKLSRTASFNSWNSQRVCVIKTMMVKQTPLKSKRI